jgi:hypothetical protein
VQVYPSGCRTAYIPVYQGGGANAAGSIMRQ